ncbi:MAG: tetratricopeptide repeat protein [Cyanobacteria bacterium]|nr:tetratricopeptide repeat protein [Cyanobacteriota bacterium]
MVTNLEQNFPPDIHDSMSLSEGVASVRSNVGFGSLASYGLVKITGPDAISFLQNRTSHDVQSLKMGAGQYSSLLDRKAHVESFFSLHRLDSPDISLKGASENQKASPTFWLLCEKAWIPQTIDALEKFHVMEQVKIESQGDEWALFTCQGPKGKAFSKTLLNLDDQVELSSLLEAFLSDQTPDNAMMVLPWDSTPCLLVKRSFSGEWGVCFAVPSAVAPAFSSKGFLTLKEMNGSLVTDPLIEVLRVESGWPRMGLEMGLETILPETGLEQVAVSYTKGCYLGQETVARVKTYGAVQRALMGLKFILPPDVEPSAFSFPTLNTPCVVSGETVGIFKTALYSPTLKAPIAMAYLSKAFRVPGKVLSLTYASESGQEISIEAMVVSLPFYQNAKGSQKAKILLDKGLSAFAQDQEALAIDFLRQALALDSTLADAYEALGVILSRQENYEEAISLMQKLVEVDPDRIMAHTNLSVYYMKLGDKELAEEEKAKALVLSMKKAAQEAMTKKGALQKDEAAEKEKRDALLRDRIGLFEKALQLNPEDPLANFGMGGAYLELKDFAKAIGPFQKAIQGQPNHSVAYLSLGKSLEGAGQIQEAKAIYHSGIEVASRKGDRMPLEEMQQRLEILESL